MDVEMHQNYSMWSNDDNDMFYDKISKATLMKFLERSGLEKNADLQLIKEYIFSASSILEVGAGYGRVIEYLICNGFSGDIVAIEKCKKFYGILCDKFSSQAKIINVNLLDLKMEKKFDLILWLWFGILDFTESEQFIALKKLLQLLSPAGHIIIDTIYIDCEQKKIPLQLQRNQIMKADGLSLRRHIVSTEEIKNYAQKLNLNKITYFTYSTSEKNAINKRRLHVLSS